MVLKLESFQFCVFSNETLKSSKFDTFYISIRLICFRQSRTKFCSFYIHQTIESMPKKLVVTYDVPAWRPQSSISCNVP